MLGLLVSTGFLFEDGNGGYTLAPDATKRTLFLYGDRLSITNVEHLYPTLRERVHATDSPLADVYLQALARVRLFGGDLHSLMHMARAPRPLCLHSS